MPKACKTTMKKEGVLHMQGSFFIYKAHTKKEMRRHSFGTARIHKQNKTGCEIRPSASSVGIIS